MLATFDSQFTTCDYLNNPSAEKDAELLKRAKASLVSNQMAFFALNEFQYFSTILFEKTFGGVFKFDVEFKQSNASLSDSILKKLDPGILAQIERINQLDLNLYKYGVNLFFKRLKFYKIFY